jgi:hypothetical protein
MTARIFETQVSRVRALGLDGLFEAAGQMALCGALIRGDDAINREGEVVHDLAHFVYELGVKRGTLNGLEGAVKHSTSDAPIRPVRVNELAASLLSVKRTRQTLATLPVVDSREERLAKNEVLFREINERIEEAAAPHGRRDGHVFEFFCECSNADCTLLLPMTLASYEAVRSNPEAFVIAPGHDLPEIETVIARHPAYQVVRKGGEAAALARDTDPRG